MGVQHERDVLEGQLAEHQRRIHDLEAHLMDPHYHSKGCRNVETYVAKGITRFRRSTHCMNGNTVNDVFGMMRERHNKIQHEANNFEGELQELYARKEQVEADIADRRQVTAANEALERARSELPHTYS